MESADGVCRFACGGVCQAGHLKGSKAITLAIDNKQNTCSQNNMNYVHVIIIIIIIVNIIIIIVSSSSRYGMSGFLREEDKIALRIY